ncbi:MAG: hypothetical protein AB1781_06070 [Pseudomonadota bacterium]
MTKSSQAKPSHDREMSRRKALARLGLGVAAAYAAPVLLHLDGSAMATVQPSPCGKGPGKDGPCPSEPSKPSRPSRPGPDKD